MKILSLLLCCVAVLGCRQISNTTTKTLPTTTVHLELLTPETAFELIENDTEFSPDLLEPLDLCLQLKDAACNATKAELIKRYRQQLRLELTPFSTEQSKKMRALTQNAYQEWIALFPQYPLDTIRLGILKGTLYGDGVYFTAGDGIFSPLNEIRDGSNSQVQSVLFHEIVHIASRTYPALRTKTYAAIGARHYPNWTLVLTDSLFQHRQLRNPDGTALTTFELTDSLTIQTAIPLIEATSSHQPGTRYFDHIAFNLFPVQVDSARQQLIVFTAEPVRNTYYDNFLSQITDNTTYIIHPDEIIAENLRLMSDLENGRRSESELSTAGKKLMEALDAVATSR